MSLLSWERGLKYYILHFHYLPIVVAPLVGAWIEINIIHHVLILLKVAPLVGAWIEIKMYKVILALS